MNGKVLRVCDVQHVALTSLLERYGLDLEVENDGAPIRGSFWGDTEAGIVGRSRLMSDMDTWGCSFRLGSTLEWFRKDAEDAGKFL